VLAATMGFTTFDKKFHSRNVKGHTHTSDTAAASLIWKRLLKGNDF
jgi:hypothetical protein